MRFKHSYGSCGAAVRRDTTGSNPRHSAWEAGLSRRVSTRSPSGQERTSADNSGHARTSGRFNGQISVVAERTGADNRGQERVGGMAPSWHRVVRRPQDASPAVDGAAMRRNRAMREVDPSRDRGLDQATQSSQAVDLLLFGAAKGEPRRAGSVSSRSCAARRTRQSWRSPGRHLRFGTHGSRAIAPTGLARCARRPRCGAHVTAARARRDRCSD
jgi:hypothetical protein